MSTVDDKLFQIINKKNHRAPVWRDTTCSQSESSRPFYLSAVIWYSLWQPSKHRQNDRPLVKTHQSARSSLAGKKHHYCSAANQKPDRGWVCRQSGGLLHSNQPWDGLVQCPWSQDRGQCLWPIRDLITSISQLEGLVQELSNFEASDQLKALLQSIQPIRKLHPRARRGWVCDQSEALQISISQSEGFIQEPDGGGICDHGWQTWLSLWPIRSRANKYQPIRRLYPGARRWPDLWPWLATGQSQTR